ncbi:MAG TPA: Asp-tRNA(Asn)/Glu-tRNA(Gln) amidotransferase subunit GatC [Leptospiraceae bacterium]|nr:Asp-tRNA(Asn)/Glu-tRNA(Gln) amidotransferase subunit GatC [Leptospiraceae bacterium]HMY67018.1 Asp-tRNA(Asn)/Glu-tRNA(Gln) amidotransferase subunit GatC [Leptospiraceae bacterium]HMZ60098.1 Asp-tRNA(Asn)/Glu-tRNA(Gln) amidotransferase subunit GatC [Leptospiraceae bacterium]HNF16033.1 Asp-tRNA(Asn)/Glu-tRNA(Gln) amidotransferase subunit GatC [Leptospiraceae bacterium]HNF27265.1 Asp-tRNA(Asn)/Glu-tRNA(Gln) amidotransferase subunit GatC [Leptospiraceae bacterium]
MDGKKLKEIAYLARLKIEEGEMDSMLRDFNSIQEYVDHVKELDTSSVTEEDIYFHVKNFTRPDKTGESLNREKIAAVAPAYENGYVIVPKVIET